MYSLRGTISQAPRFHLFTRSPLTARPFGTGVNRLSKDFPSSSFGGFANPAPPRLPKDEQERFEALQRQSTGAFSTPRAPPQINQSPHSSTMEQEQANDTIAERAQNTTGNESSRLEKEFAKVIEARGKGEELHPNVRRGAEPEFEGDTNPKTGEVGGPKNEPLRWGAAGEWSYNGRTTDF